MSRFSAQPVTGHPSVTDRLIRFPEVRQLTGLSRSTIWRMENEGRFPHHVNISPSIAGWWASDIETFLNSLKQAGRGAA